MKLEVTALLTKHRDADYVGRQQVARELNTLEAEPEYAGERLGKRRLAESRQVFDQQVAPGEESGQRERHFLVFAENDAVQGLARRVERVASGILGNGL